MMFNHPADPQTVNQRLLKALDLGPEHAVRAVTLKFAVDASPVAVIELLPTAKQMDAVLELLPDADVQVVHGHVKDSISDTRLQVAIPCVCGHSPRDHREGQGCTRSSRCPCSQYQQEDSHAR